MKYNFNYGNKKPGKITGVQVEDTESYFKLKLSEQFDMFKDLFINNPFNTEGYIKEMDRKFPHYKEFNVRNEHYSIPIIIRSDKEDEIIIRYNDEGEVIYNKSFNLIKIFITNKYGNSNYDIEYLFKISDNQFNRHDLFYINIDLRIYYLLKDLNIITSESPIGHHDINQRHAFLDLKKIIELTMEEVTLYDITNI